MQKTFLEFNDRAIALGIQQGAPALAGYLQTTAEKLSELAKNSTEDSDIEEEENDPTSSVQPMAAEHRSQPQGRELGPEPASMLGYQTTFGEEEDEEEEDAGEIAAPPAQSDLDNHLPLSDWAGTENMQQLRSEGSKSTTWGQNNTRPMRRDWVNVLDNNIEQFLRSKGLYLDGQYSTAFGPIDPSIGLKGNSLPAVSSPYYSPSLNSSGGPHTPESINAPWRNNSNSNGNHMFWNESTNVSKASGVDTDDSFDNRSILL